MKLSEHSSYQFVSWFPDWVGFGFTRLNPDKTNMALIYQWYFYIGYWEIRKWNTNFLAIKRGQMGISLLINGRARPKERARRGRHGFYTPSLTSCWEASVSFQARSQYSGKPLEGRLTLHLLFSLKSFGRSDLSNFIKSIEDGLRGIVYKDDSQIDEIIARRQKGQDEYVRVEVETWKIPLMAQVGKTKG